MPEQLSKNVHQNKPVKIRKIQWSASGFGRKVAYCSSYTEEWTSFANGDSLLKLVKKVINNASLSWMT